MKKLHINFTATASKKTQPFHKPVFLAYALIFKAFQLMGGLEPLTSTLPMWCRFLGRSVTW